MGSASTKQCHRLTVKLTQFNCETVTLSSIDTRLLVVVFWNSGNFLLGLCVLRTTLRHKFWDSNSVVIGQNLPPKQKNYSQPHF